MEHQITEEEKIMGKRVRDALGYPNEYFLECRDYQTPLRKKGYNELADFLDTFGVKHGMKMADIISEIMVDEELGDELAKMSDDFSDVEERDEKRKEIILEKWKKN